MVFKRDDKHIKIVIRHSIEGYITSNLSFADYNHIFNQTDYEQKEATFCISD
jgi:hypothetical protein